MCAANAEVKQSSELLDVPNERVQKLEESVARIENDINQLAAGLQIVARGMDAGEDDDNEPQRERAVMLDQWWQCRKCQRRLAIYDGENDTMRISHKGFTAYMKPGEGGSIVIICTRCSEQNTLDHEPNNSQEKE